MSPPQTSPNALPHAPGSPTVHGAILIRQAQTEPPRVFRRLPMLRGGSHGKTRTVSCGGPGARGSVDGDETAGEEAPGRAASRQPSMETVVSRRTRRSVTMRAARSRCSSRYRSVTRSLAGRPRTRGRGGRRAVHRLCFRTTPSSRIFRTSASTYTDPEDRPARSRR